MKHVRKPSAASRVAKWRERFVAHKHVYATVAVTALAAVMGVKVFWGQNGLVSYWHKQAEQRSLTTQMRSLEVENERLRGHVERLENDPDAIEHQAREELHYTRSGEVIYTLPPDPESPAQTASTKAVARR